MNSNEKSILSIKNVSVIYRNGTIETVAVKDLSMDIFSSGITVIMGKSGSGKSSLLNVIGGMKCPDAGSVIFEGRDISQYSDKELTCFRRDNVGFVFQNYNLLGSLTALENVNIAATLTKDAMSPSEMLNLVGLEGMSGKYPRQLSGGEQQRVCIARAIVKNAGMLLCDEPTGALDTENSGKVVAILERISIQHKIPVVIVTHNPDFLKIASHYIIMRNGEITEEKFNPCPMCAKDVF